MGMLFVFTGLGLVLFIGAVIALVWSIRSGQLDDLDTPAMRVLVDDAAPTRVPTPVPRDGPTANDQPPRSP